MNLYGDERGHGVMRICCPNCDTSVSGGRTGLYGEVNAPLCGKCLAALRKALENLQKEEEQCLTSR